MYEVLAVSLRLNKGSPAEVKAALGGAAYLAKRSNDPAQMTNVADLLVINGLDAVEVTDARGRPERITVADLIDLAARKVPYSSVPMLMSLNLAVRTRAPVRFADAAERLLSLGWPGVDEVSRAEIRRQGEALASWLRGQDRGDDAETLLKRLAEAESRDLVLRLTWKGDADLDLVVDEPLGATCRYESPRTVFGGALVKNGYGKHPEEVYVCPRGFAGDYKVHIRIIYNDEKAPVREATLEVITHEGTARQHRETRTIRLPKPPVEVVHLDRGRRTEVLPYQAPPRLQIVRDPSKAPQSATSTAAPAPKPKPDLSREAQRGARPTR